MDLGYRIFKVTARVEINGIVLPVTSISVDYALNELPQAVCRFALGTDGNGVDSLAAIKLPNFGPRATARIYANLAPQGRYTPPSTLVGADPPIGDLLLFEGETAWNGFVVNEGSVQYEIRLDHWLADLSYASAISPSISPATPADFAFPMVTRIVSPDTKGGQATSGGFSAVGSIAKLLTPEITADLWRGGFLKLYQFLASSDHLADASLSSPLGYVLNSQFGVKSTTGNAQALAALTRMNIPSAPVLDLIKPSGGVGSAIAAGAISTSITQATLDALVNESIWDHLIRSSSEYLFSVSTGPNDTYLVPWLPNLRTVNTKIYSGEYHSFQGSGENLRTIRGVILTTGKDWSTGAGLSAAGDNPQINREFGFATYKAGGDTGRVVVRQAPSWLAGVPQDVVGAFPNTAQGLVVPTPGAPSVALAGGAAAVATNPANALTTMYGYLSAYAKGYFGIESLTHRVGAIDGRLRFDIRPGTIVSVETGGRGASGNINAMGPIITAAVTRVSITIDAQGETGMTTLTLGHLRTAAENNSDLTLTSHPLYNTTWTGGPLIEG